MQWIARTLVLAVLGLISCRDGTFDKRPLGTEQVALTIVPLESQRIGACADKPNCHQLQVNFEVRSRDGRILSEESLSLTASHKERVISEPSTSTVDPRGLVSFVVQFEEQPHEQGLRFQTLFVLSSKSWGDYSFCALVEPTLSAGPVHSFKSCESKNFQASVFGQLPSFDVETKDVVVLDVPQSKGPSRIATLRATFSVRDLKLLTPAADLPMNWTLTFSGETRQGTVTTYASGDFDIDFTMAFSPFKNEENHLVTYSVEPTAAPDRKVIGYFLLNFEKDNIRPLVAKGRGAPVFTATSPLNGAGLVGEAIQTIALNPKILRLVTDESTFELDHELRMTSARTYHFQTEIALSRTRLTGAPEIVKLGGNRIIGKCFLVNPITQEIVHEEAFDLAIDPESGLNLVLAPSVYNFSKKSNDLRVYLALNLPDFHDVPSAYFEITPDGTSRALTRGDAEKILQDRLLEWTTQVVPLTTRETKKEDLLKGFVDIQTAPDNIVPAANRSALRDRLNRAWNSDSAASWIEIYQLLRPQMSKDQRKQIDDKFVFENMRVREIVFVTELEDKFLESQNVANLGARFTENHKFKALRYSFRVKGKGERCLSISLNPQSSGPSPNQFYFCFDEKAVFDITDNWYVMEDLNSVDGNRFLLKDPLPTDLSNENLKKVDLFLNPRLHRPRLVSQMLWPRVTK